MRLRSVRLSKTFNDQLIELIDHGELEFGRRVAEQKKELLLATIENLLARSPGLKRPHEKLGSTVYPISRTPFSVLYDYDDEELRLHFVFRTGASFDDLDPASAEW